MKTKFLVKRRVWHGNTRTKSPLAGRQNMLAGCCCGDVIRFGETLMGFMRVTTDEELLDVTQRRNGSNCYGKVSGDIEEIRGWLIKNDNGKRRCERQTVEWARGKINDTNRKYKYLKENYVPYVE